VTTKKPRKSLGDTLANNFVYGDKASLPTVEPVVKTVEPVVEQIEPMVKAVATEETSAPISAQPPTSLMSRLMQNTPEKEPTVRLTVDLPQSTHKKLSILCANTGMKKVEVVRMLLDDALKDTKT
jgi:hypothetical protein